MTRPVPDDEDLQRLLELLRALGASEQELATTPPHERSALALDLVLRGGRPPLTLDAAAEAIGKPVSLHMPPEQEDDFPAIMSRLRRGERVDHYETVRMHKDGRRIPVSVTVSPLVAADGTIIGASAIARDISERRRSEAKIVHMALHDALTDLPNRVLFNERLEQALTRVRRGDALAVHLLDLDHFKNVNDTLGHPAGDKLLKMVTERLHAVVRETDTIARILSRYCPQEA